MFTEIGLARWRQWWRKRHPLLSAAAHNIRMDKSYSEYKCYATALVYILDYYMLFSYGYG